MTHVKKIASGDSGPGPAVRPCPGPWVALALIVILLIVCGCSNRTLNQPAAARGVIDLSAWDFSSRGTVDLDGEWEFYWNRLLSPEDFSGKPQAGPVEYITMPRFWNGQIIAGTKLPGHGFATMRLTVRLGGSKNIYSMIIPQMHTAYLLWVNGRPVSSNGKIGTGAASETPEFLPKIVIVSPDRDTLDLVLQVSNFHHPKGGMWSSIQLGKDTQILNKQRYLAGFHSMLFGGLLLMSLYHIGIFLFRKKDLASLFFGILCLIMALRIPFENDRMILGLFPWLSWEIAQKISYFTLFTSMPIMNLYLYHLFPEIYARVMVRVSNVIGTAFCLALLVLATQIYFYARYPWYAAMLVFALYDVYVIVRAVMLKKEGASYLAGGMVILLVTAVVDILYHDRIIHYGNVSSFGVFVFTLSQAMLLSERSSKAFTRIEILSSEKAHLFASSIGIISSILLTSSTRLFEYTQNVTRLSIMLARRIGIPADGVEEIRIASLLHDIGMVGHAEELAGRLHRLTDAEKLILENHPRKSIEIIEELKGLAGVKLIIAQHHERYNGSGYPSRLRGKQITVGARIIGLVDDFVSMLSRREFQVEDKKGRIISELARGEGELYDPDITDVLIGMIEKENLVYIINEDDIRYEKKGEVSEWVFPSNVNYEMSVVEKVVAEMKSRAGVDDEVSYLIEFGLGETIRNAIIHGNKYDETKQVTVKFSVQTRDNRKVLEFRIADQGSGMDYSRYHHFKESRIKLYDIVRSMKQHIPSLENTECRDVFGDLNKKLQNFLMEYYINYNQYRQIDSPEATGGIGLIQVMQTFDNVDFRQIVENNTLCGMEVMLEKFID